MSVCACGQLMDLHDGWCKRCWAVWSTWYMRARGRWIDFNLGVLCMVQTCTGDRGLPCTACRRQAVLQAGADYAEDVATSRRTGHDSGPPRPEYS